jgi:predicted enzyme related to lactoylglutathione lyase
MRIWTIAAGLIASPALWTPALQANDDEQLSGVEKSEARQKVLGIGGLFFRAENPAALAAWYKKHLGIDRVPTSYDVEPWIQEAGPTVFSPFPAASEQMGNPGKQWVINFRVADIDAFVAQLRADGITVQLDPQTYPNGRFASLDDPEGHPIQLWEPAVP